MATSAVSVLTPTYNRAHVLHRVDDSLNRQKTRDFEWIVVDDSSTNVSVRWAGGLRAVPSRCGYGSLKKGGAGQLDPDAL